MNKRDFLIKSVAFAAAVPFGGPQAAWSQTKPASICADGVCFEWWHQTSRLHGKLRAPTDGWIAVGFNANQGLQNTRFVIASVADLPIRVEEHIALVPDHRDVSDLGLEPAFSDVEGSASQGQSRLTLSLPHRYPDGPIGSPRAPNLAPGQSLYLMLAWSHESDFGHHSAWRRHYFITL